MKTKTIINRVAICIIAVMSLLSTYPGNCQQSMSLGSLQFVMPDQKAVRANRALHVKVAKTGITPKVVSKVGGVAFVQTAEPDNKVNSLSLGVDFHKNSAYTIINDTMCYIPLEVWELQSIVNYANDTDNAAVTLFGSDSVRIKYHNAFLDNLMGLRILQTDLIFTSFLNGSDKGKLPAYSDGQYIMSPKEESKYKMWSDIDFDYFDKTYEDHAYVLYQDALFYMDSIGEYYDTYIYTDYDQPIRFSISNGELKFVGLPYYRFSKRDPILVDTLEMYHVLKEYVVRYNGLREKYNKYSFSHYFTKNNNPVVHDIQKIIGNGKKIQKKAIAAFIRTNYYAMCDTFGINNESLLYDFYLMTFVKDYLNQFADSIAYYGSSIPELEILCYEYLSITDSLDYFDYPIVSAYVNSFYDILPTDSTIFSLKLFMDEKKITFDKALIEYMFLYKTAFAYTLDRLTQYFKENHWLTYGINPIVYDAAEKTCQWSAFFRYVKENYENEWLAFVKNVQKLSYDAPRVQTPINFIDSIKESLTDEE